MATPAASSKPRDIESEETRRAILDAAEQLLARDGQREPSVREVCARAGVTPPTLYHHFGDKAALIDRVVEECFEAFDRAFAARAAPSDPVERLRWGFDRYVEYGVAHPVHYRLLFLRRLERPSAAGMASYDRLRRMVAAVAAHNRLKVSLEDAAAAFWAAVHGVTSLRIGGFWAEDNPAIALVRDAVLEELTHSPPARLRRTGGREGRRS